MAKRKEKFDIEIKTPYGMTTLCIVPLSQADMWEKESSDGNDGLMRYQLVEGAMYQYKFDRIGGVRFQFIGEDEIVTFSKLSDDDDTGTIKTGIHVGQYSAEVVRIDSHEVVGELQLEIRSVKTDYVSDYRTMLSDIAESYTDLVLQQGAPVTQRLEIDNNTSAKTLYQRFCFIRGIIDSEAFKDAMHKIMSAPVRKWADATIRPSIVNMRRLSRKNIRDIVSQSDRVPLPEDCRGLFPDGMTTVPRMLESDNHVDSIDNSANQFVKFALRSFEMFCSDLYGKQNASVRLKNEVSDTKEKINEYLDSSFFRVVSSPSHLTLNSPVLQRKEGYREVFQSWLMFDLAAKLNWTGGDNVYEAGKKDVATLYEYWLFLKLKDLVSEYFHISPAGRNDLVTADENGIDLNLVQGKTTVVQGKSQSNIRPLNVAFYYNRTFGKIAGDSIHRAGSWTTSMRPDYTLSIWPGEISEAEAESMDLITHVHFDAKYRLKKILIESKEEDIEASLQKEAEEQEMGIYKRGDLLKMHAYKDAIRRTSGAYILYPGTEPKTLKGFHEILPGLGAFPVRPGKWDEDSRALKKFLSDIKAHFFDRTSEREKLSYFQYNIYKEPNSTTIHERLPEPVGENRDFLPDEISVVVAYYKGDEHLQWIMSKSRYNMMVGNRKGSMNISPDIVNARYLLLHDTNECQRLLKIVPENPNSLGPKVMSHAELGEDYPRGSEEEEKMFADCIYLVYTFAEAEPELQKYSWELAKEWDIKPHTMKLDELVRKAKKN